MTKRDKTKPAPPTPGKARTIKATETLIRRTDERYAARLREHGWIVTPPEQVEWDNSEE